MKSVIVSVRPFSIIFGIENTKDCKDIVFLLLSPSYLYLSSWVHNGPAWLWLFSDCPPNPVSPYLTGCHQPCNQHQPVKPSDLYCSNISPGRCLTVSYSVLLCFTLSYCVLLCLTLSYCVLLLDPGQHTVCFPSDPENDGAWRSPSKCPALCALNAQNYQLIKSEMSLM